MSRRGAYRLLEADGADDFARAWAVACEEGLARLRTDALGRALHGALVPVYRRGRLVRTEHRFNERLAIALLSGHERLVEERLHDAVYRRAYRRALLKDDADRAAAKREEEQRRVDYREELERMVEEGERIAAVERRPRIRAL